jgi:hypothetical protein
VTILSQNFLRSGDLEPNLILGFTTPTLNPMISFSRSLGTATRVNASGFVEPVNADVARFDYDPATLALRGLLIEGARTNTWIRSSEFNETAWVKNACTVSANAVISPDGSLNADKLEETATTAIHRLQQNFTAAGETRTQSAFFKAAERSIIYFTAPTSTGGKFAWFNISTGAKLTIDPAFTSSTIENYGNGWYRCSVTYVTGSGTSAPFIGVTNANGVASYLGVAGSGVYLWGAQLETGASLTSHIQTTTTAITRNADVATITGTNFSDWWRAGKGSAVVRVRPSTISGTCPLIQFDDTTAGNIISLRGNTTNPELYVRAGGSDQAQIDAGTIAANTSYRLAGAWDENNCAASFNSGAPVLDGFATIPVVTQARLGSDGTNYLNGHLEAVEYYEDRVLNSTLQVVSSAAGYLSIISPVFRDAIIS